VVAAAELRETGLAAARSIAAKAPVAVRLAKQAVQRGQGLDLANACAHETSLFALAFATADQKEGMRAFVEKRAPRFSGK
jgi:enoyl-CoA hydratase